MPDNITTKLKIDNELTQLGVSKVEQKRKIFKVLSSFVDSDENILAIVHGRNAQHWQSLLVATSKRVIYVEAEMLFSTKDEIPYQSITGSEIVYAPVFTGVVLKALARNYKISYANKKQVLNFISVVKKRVQTPDDKSNNTIEHTSARRPTINEELHEQKDVKIIPLSKLSDKVRSYIESHHYILIIDALRTGDFSTKLARYEISNSEIYLISHEPIPNTVINAVIPDRPNLGVLQIQALFEEQINNENSDYIYRLVLTDIIG